MKYEKIIITVLVIVSITTVLFSVKGAIQSINSGRLYDQLRIELTNTTDTNRQLTDTIEQCRTIVTGLRTSTEKSITTTRQAVEILEELRNQIQELESCLYGDSASYDYNYWDSYLGID